jgi:hypothetical protein
MQKGLMKRLADRVASRYIKRGEFFPPDGAIRDECDLASCGELTFFQLNMLIDMVESRLLRASAKHWDSTLI